MTNNSRILGTLALVCGAFQASCGSHAEEGDVGTASSAILGSDTYLYLTCGATGWQPDDSTRFVGGSTPEQFSVTYEVTEDWMVTGPDSCALLETNQLNDWGSEQTRYAPRDGAAIDVPLSGPAYAKLVSNQSGFQVNYAIKGTYKATVNWANGTLWIERQVDEGRDMSQYPARAAFLVSDADWRAALTLAPVTTWHTTRADELADCTRPYGGADDTCAYPTLILHEESAGIDVDPIAHLLDEYDPSVVLHHGELPGEVVSALGDHNLQPMGNPLGYWGSITEVVISADDYATALTAAPYASWRGVPLLIDGYNDDVDLNGMNVICVGSSNSACDEQLTVEELQARYVSEADLDRVVLTNAADLDQVHETLIPIELERTGGTMRDLYGRLSLVAPLVAAAKKQLVLAMPDAGSTADDVDLYLEGRLAALDLVPEYLTIVGAAHVLPQAKYGSHHHSSSGEAWTQADGSIYADLDGDYFQEIKVGRIFSYAPSGVSAYVARTLAYDQLPHSSTYAALQSFNQHSAYGAMLYAQQALTQLGFTGEIATTEYGTSFDSQVFHDRGVITYRGHGYTGGGQGGFNLYTLRDEQLWLPSSLVVMGGCSTCSYNNAVSGTGQVFCAEAIRRGAIGVTGTTDDDSDNNRPWDHFFYRVVRGQTFGTAMQQSLNLGTADLNLRFSPFAMLIGDPTFDLGLQGGPEMELLHTDIGALVQDGSSYVLPATINLEAADTLAFRDMQITADTVASVVTAPFYSGDATFRSYARSTEPGTDMTLVHVVLRFENPEGLSFSAVRLASRQVGAGTPETVDIYPHVTNHANGLTSVQIRLPLGEGFVTQTSTSVPSAQFDVELLFE